MEPELLWWPATNSGDATGTVVYVLVNAHCRTRFETFADRDAGEAEQRFLVLDASALLLEPRDMSSSQHLATPESVYDANHVLFTQLKRVGFLSIVVLEPLAAALMQAAFDC